jgi:hypothetical protein
MDIRELRCGNFIYELSDGVTQDLFVVASVNSLTNTLIDINDNITQIDYCEPIPLTEEWLEKLGFEKHRPSDNFPKGYFSHSSLSNILDFGNANEGFTPAIEDGLGECCFFGVGLLYVHQLQNLFFVLTGYELELKQLV